MAATVELVKVAFSPSTKVEISKVTFFGTPGGPNARVQMTRVSFLTPTSAPAKVELTEVGFFVRDLLDGTSFLVEFNGVSWQPIEGTLVMFDGADWNPC